MGKKPIVVGGVVGILLLITIAFVTGGPSSSAITVRRVKSVHSGGLVTANFEMTNHTTNNYVVYMWWVEARMGSVWKRCFDLRPHPFLQLYSHGAQISSLAMTNLPTGSRLRLRMGVSKELAGLETLFPRLRLRFQGGQISLNPFDKRTKVFGVPTQIVSDEFVEPESNHIGQGRSDR